MFHLEVFAPAPRLLALYQRPPSQRGSRYCDHTYD
jgi:hypothetical protein